MKPTHSFVLALVAGLAASASAQTSYEVIDLGNLGSAYASVTCVNDAGEAVGLSDNGAAVHAFYWNGGPMIDLGTLPGGGASKALWINNQHQIVGSAVDANGNERPVTWRRNAQQAWQIMDLGTLGGASGFANKISDTGFIVGQAYTAAGKRHAFRASGGVMTDLGILAYPPNTAVSEAVGVNAAGNVVGYAYAPLWGPDHAFYSDGTTTTDITPTGQFSFARGEAINTGGTAAGITILPGGQSSGFEAATWTQAGGWREIGVLPGLTESEAYGINDGGDVVGRSFDVGTQVYRGFVYRGGQMADLTDETGEAPPIVEALAINSNGWIAANATDDFVAVRALVLRPVSWCYPNCDASTAAPVLNVNDFICFQTRFAAGDTYANCDASTSAPVLNVNDFICFQTQFAAGCR